jgi:hypothetical protein
MTAPSNSGAVRRLLALCVALTAVFVGACSGGPDSGPLSNEPTIEREVFIRTYVILRQTALSNPSGDISEADRDRILGGEGITADELEAFARVHGPDAAYMRGVWDEVERRLRVAAGEIPDTVGPAAVPPLP